MKPHRIAATVLLLALFALSAAAGDGKYTVFRRVRILHTNDLHSHLLGFGPNADYTPMTTGDDDTVGGVARLATAVSTAREEGAENRASILYLDGGDWTQGTLFALLSPIVSPELRLLHQMGCDATTFGNHEFDWGPKGTAYIVNGAGALDQRTPIVASNLVFDPNDPGDDELEAMAAAGYIVPDLVVELENGVRVGLIGLMGRSAAFVVPQAKPVTFRDPYEAAAEEVQKLRGEGVDLVVVLSHSGVDPDPTKSEDVGLAALVPGIDVVVSAHTHTVMPQPIPVPHQDGSTTWVIQAGSYGRWLGVMDLRVFNTKPPELEAYDLRPIDDSIEGDAHVDADVGWYASFVDGLIGPFSMDKILAHTDFPITLSETSEAPLANLVTDAMRAVTSSLELVTTGKPVDFAFETATQVRDEILPGQTGLIRFQDAFRAMPLGVGPDQKPGWPLITFNITGPELVSALEITATLSDLVSSDFFIQVSGLRFSYDPSAPPFQRVREVAIGDELHGYVPFDVNDPRLWKVTTNAFLASFIGGLGEASGGAIQIVPKHDDGTPILDPFSVLIDRDPTTPELEELKEWQAVASYLGQLPDANGDGIPDVPPIYAQPTGRITTVTGASASALCPIASTRAAD